MSENSRVTLCEDGKYRWTYSLNLFKDFSVFFTVWKILFLIFAAGFAVMTVADACRFEDFYPERLLYNLRFGGYITIGITAISLLGYLIYAAMMGGRYTVEFIMDEKGITHRQTADGAKKAKKMGAFTAALGASRGNFGAVSAGIAAQRTQLYSEFSKVRRIKCNRKKCIIKISSLFNHNQVYTAPEDFDFVKDHIISRCENAKK